VTSVTNCKKEIKTLSIVNLQHAAQPKMERVDG